MPLTARIADNLGGGPENAISLLQLIDEIGAIVGHAVELRFEDWRQGDQRWFVADTHKAREALDLPRPRAWRDGVQRLAEWLANERGHQLHPDLRLASAAG